LALFFPLAAKVNKMLTDIFVYDNKYISKNINKSIAISKTHAMLELWSEGRANKNTNPIEK